MTIKVGDKIPNIVAYRMDGDSPAKITTDEIFSGKKVVLFALPGAFTPTCSMQHVPSYMNNTDELFAKGVDTIVCLSVNDVFVMSAWADSLGVNQDQILMLADGSGDITQALGLELDLTGLGLGVRSDRYAMIVEDGIVKELNREGPGAFEVSDAQSMISLL